MAVYLDLLANRHENARLRFAPLARAAVLGRLLMPPSILALRSSHECLEVGDHVPDRGLRFLDRLVAQKAVPDLGLDLFDAPCTRMGPAGSGSAWLEMLSLARVMLF